MKKHNKKKIILILVILCTTILSLLNSQVVMADPKISIIEPGDSKKYEDLTPKELADYKYYAPSVELVNDSYIELKANHGSFAVTTKGNNSAGYNSLENSYSLTPMNPIRIPYNPNYDLSIQVTLELTEQDPNYTPKSGDVIKAKYETTITKGVANQLEINDSYNGICKTFRDEVAAMGPEAVEFMKSAMSYCYREQVEANYSKSNLKSMIKNVKASWEIKEKAKNNIQGQLPESVGFKEVDNTNIDSTLKCDPWSKEKNVEKYVHTKLNVVKNDVCHTDCKEELTVVYDAPIATKAGLCFTYTVEVKSKVTCATEIREDSKPQMPAVCNPYPYCTHNGGDLGSWWNDQAGPTEDFDKCILECDKGKYSQSCINKCYKKVYGASSTKQMLSYNSDVKAQKINNNSAPRCNQNASIESIYSDILENGKGYYAWSNEDTKSGFIQWVHEDNCNSEWIYYGRYYFNSLEKARRTIIDYRQNGAASGYPAQYYPEKSWGSTKGIKRRHGCIDNCRWKGCSAGTNINPEQAQKEYEAALEEYNRKIAECNNYAKCEEKTTTFNMSVLPSDGKNNWVDYTATNKPNNTTDGSKKEPAGDSIINDHTGVCYGDVDAEGNDYRTLINFPGVWTYNKDGSVVTKRPPKNEEVYYKHKPNQFCTPINALNVNKDWWNWERGLANYTDDEKAVITKNLKYNIKASIKNFGRFNWKLNIKCFYAINNEIPEDDTSCNPATDPNCTPPEKNNCPANCDINDPKCEGCTTDFTNYRYKAAALDDLFVGEKETTNPTETGRETGWNWSCAATDLSDKTYPVAPTALITDIQGKGDSIYKNDSKYLDYSITLTPSTISKIKATNRKQKTFLNYTGTRDKKKDTTVNRSVYRSALLDELGTGVVTTRYTSAIGCNNQEGGKCVTSSMITKDSCITSYEALAGSR